MTEPLGSKAPEKKRTILRLFDLIFPYKGWIFLSILCMIGFNIFTAAPVYYAKDIVDAIAYGDEPQLRQYFLVGLGMVLVFALKGVFYFGNTYSVGHLVMRLISQLRQNLFDHLLTLSSSFFSQSKTGDIISRFSNDLNVFQTTLHVGVTGPFRDIPQFFLLLGIMAYRSWELALLTTIIIPFALFFIRLFGKSNKVAVSERQQSFSELSTLLLETVSGIRVVKAFSMENYEKKRFNAANENLYQDHMRSVLISSYSNPVIEIIGAIAGATIVAYGGFLIIQGEITAGDFTSFILSFFMLNEPVKKLNGFNLKLQEGLAAIRRIFEVIDTPSEITSDENSIKIKSFETQIELNFPQFKYTEDGEIVLQNIQLTVARGEIIALVGSSGSGKSTLVNLVPRFYDVAEGRISIDGINIKELDLTSLRSLIAVVTQETILFNDTIASNITYGQPDCSREKMEQAAKAAYAHDFIMEQPHGYDTFIGEKGLKLSGGQRQRLSIARALLKDAPILILDEATSALDSESEVEVQKAIESLMEERTTIVIAHRLSTIRHAHRICVMEKGSIVEQGTHEKLLKQKGRYHQLHEIQLRSEEKEKKE